MPSAAEMEIQVIKQPFLKELQLLQGIIERKNTMPILANLRLTADTNGIELTASTIPSRPDGSAAQSTAARWMPNALLIFSVVHCDARS